MRRSRFHPISMKLIERRRAEKRAKAAADRRFAAARQAPHPGRDPDETASGKPFLFFNQPSAIKLADIPPGFKRAARIASRRRAGAYADLNIRPSDPDQKLKKRKPQPIATAMAKNPITGASDQAQAAGLPDGFGDLTVGHPEDTYLGVRSLPLGCYQ